MSNNNAYGTTTGTGVYEENEVVTISASAYSGYEFVSWSDGNTGNPRQITVTGNATYVANFAETGSVPQVSYTITVLSSDASAGTEHILLTRRLLFPQRQMLAICLCRGTTE